jgi:hypothetical protein
LEVVNLIEDTITLIDLETNFIGGSARRKDFQRSVKNVE